MHNIKSLALEILAIFKTVSVIVCVDKETITTLSEESPSD
jgi:hypothetical protein